jgi:EAL domain-containing protein (putative c-di-GMP-specific phosphodiesterase class I)/CheY-like chemotaxis protein
MSTLLEDHETAKVAPAHVKGSTLPQAYVVDDEDGICKLITLALSPIGLRAEKFHTASDAVAALERHLPAIVFLDVALRNSDAVEVIRGLGERGYRGIVQLMSGSNVELLEDVRRIGTRHGLNMRPPLTKPFGAEEIRHAVAEIRLSAPEKKQSSNRPVAISLDEALDQGWLELWYQPKIDLRKNVCEGAEGLIRCRHPVHGVLPPASFLPGATERGQSALTEYVVATALRDWNEIAATDANIRIAVNTSIGALSNLHLATLVRELRPRDANWPGLILEITEHEVMQDPSFVHEIATQLRLYGITFAIDDFGEGFSSFARLREIPFAELKLDRSFVKDSGSDPKNAAICEAVINLAHSFGALAVAEGLENEADLQSVHRMGCDVGQGYVFARPMPKADFAALLQGRTAAARRANADA